MAGADGIVELFTGTAALVAELLAAGDTAATWQQPSALEGYTVAGLAGHLARGVLTVETYLEEPAPPTGQPGSDAVDYLVTTLADHDPVDSELHRRVRERGRETAAGGAAALAEEVLGAQQRLRERLARTSPERPLVVHGDLQLPLSEYLRTRLVELVVHLDDLATSLGRPVPAGIPVPAYEAVAAVLAGVAVHRHGGPAVVRSLARRERHPGAVRAL